MKVGSLVHLPAVDQAMQFQSWSLHSISAAAPGAAASVCAISATAAPGAAASVASVCAVSAAAPGAVAFGPGPCVI
eukprot:12737400-Heterocapsa_arctica.AAC.1